MTLAGYFNSLRELGGMRRLVEDDVRVRCGKAAERRPHDAPAPHAYFATRLLQKEPVELTSREKTGTIKEAKARLAKPHADAEHVDVLLASNMISVGVDIDRLGLMVVDGQPQRRRQADNLVPRIPSMPGGLLQAMGFLQRLRPSCWHRACGSSAFRSVSRVSSRSPRTCRASTT